MKALITLIIISSLWASSAMASSSQMIAGSNNLNPNVLNLAIKAYNCAAEDGLHQRPILTLIDYSKPSTEKRLWVIDLSSRKVLFNSLVAHGQGSGDVVPDIFSDQPNSHASSLGLFLTGDPYRGHNGLSLKLIGLEKGFNDLALSRNIVIHGARYVSNSIIQEFGRLGRSWGCPAVPTTEVAPLINTIKDRTLVFAYYPDPKWLQQSPYLHCQMITAENTTGRYTTSF